MTSLPHLRQLAEAATPNFPATHIAHWPTGPVECCEKHARQIAGLGRIMACHVAITYPAPDGAQCVNCVTEAKNQIPLALSGERGSETK